MMASEGTPTSRLAQIQQVYFFPRESAHNTYSHKEDEEFRKETKLNESWAGRRLIEALNQLPPSKFGSSTDMRFQQKQLQEREQRKMEMTASKPRVLETDNETILNITAKSTITKNLNSTIGNGKVRQIFNERRRGAGIDRSNPLKPITSRSSSSSSSLSTSMSIKNADQTLIKRQETTALRPINGRKMEKIISTKQLSQINNNGVDSVDGKNDENIRLSHKHETYRAGDFDLNNETFPDQHLDSQDPFEITLPAKIEGLIFDNDGTENDDGNNNPIDGSNPKLSAGIKLNPVLIKKSPPVIAAKLQANSSRSKQNSITSNQAKSPLNTTQKSNSSKPKIIVKTSAKMAKPLTNPNTGTKVQQKTEAPSISPTTVPCRICNRFFNEDRILKHEDVCEKMATKQRKIFDAAKHRVKGTEAEKFLKKPLRGAKAASKSSSVVSNPINDSSKKSNWRKKHEEFIAAIRAAKEVQAHLARGGKLSDLPPPPPSENPDYITCPHCSRRFNEAAANRHIPKCANMLHNKPKPVNKRR